MAKSKPTKTVKQKATKAEKPKVVKSSKVGHGGKPEPAAPRVAGALTDVEIGHVAGEVWGVLARDGELTIAAIKKGVTAPGDVVMAAIGWLAREHKLVFTMQGRSIKISLR